MVVRSADIATILDAVKKYQVDNDGDHYSVVAGMTVDLDYQIGTDGSGCDISCGGGTTQAACVDLSSIGTNYLATIPKDPKDGTDQETSYSLSRDSNGAITVQACAPEGEGAGGGGTAPTISITR